MSFLSSDACTAYVLARNGTTAKFRRATGSNGHSLRADLPQTATKFDETIVGLESLTVTHK